MESLVLLALAGAVIVIIYILTGKIQQLHSRFDAIDNELKKIRTELQTREKPESRPEIKPLPQPEYITRPAAPHPAIPVTAASPDIKPPREVAPAEKQKQVAFQETPAPAFAATAGASPANPVTTEPALSFRERFLKNNPDLEKFIGENLINKIGIAILVLGIGYFVKFAIDKDWINEIGRVFIGILAGGLLIGVAHRLRKTLPAFSSVLVGGGLAVLYFTIAIAFHEYQIFPQTAAFLIMVVITGFSILLSVSYNRVELAVLAIIGGFTTPFMLSTGEGNYLVLFMYILILNVGMLVLAYLKGWKIINWIAYGFTVILYGGWLATRVAGTLNPPYLGALVFGTLFYFIFFLMNIINNLKEKARFAPSDITILLSNTFFYYASGMFLLMQIQKGLYQGLFTVALAAFNCFFAFLLYRQQQADRNLIYLLIGLVVTFISLAIPVQLEGNYITLFWALEAVLLLWLAQKSGLQLIGFSSVIVTGLMIISLLLDWQAIYFNTNIDGAMQIMLNKGFVTSIVALVSLAATYKLLPKQPDSWHFRYIRLDVGFYRQLIGFILVVLLYFALALELHYHLSIRVASALNRTIISGTYNLAFLVCLIFGMRLQLKPRILLWVTSLGILGVFAYMVLFSPTVLELLRSYFLIGQAEFIGFFFHYLNLILVLVLIYFINRNLAVFNQYYPALPTILRWGFGIAVVFIASSELLFHVLYFNFSGQEVSSLPRNNAAEAATQFSNLIQQTNKVGFPILWGLCAFAFMFMGLQQKNKSLRIMALALFTITLVKLFTYDIRGISEGGKIAAFISLGVLLLVISFMYQNIKRIILADEAATPEKE